MSVMRVCMPYFTIIDDASKVLKT